MKNPLRPKLIPLLTLSAAMLGILVRQWLFSSGIDTKGLVVSAHPANILGFVLVALVFAGIFLCLQSVKENPAYRKLFPASAFSAVGSWIAAVGIGITLIGDLERSEDNITLICNIVGIASVLSLLAVGYFRLKGIRPNPIFHTLVTVYLMLHLVCQYRGWSSETQLSVYFFRLMASIFLMLSTYHLATLDARMGNIKAALFFWYGALFFCCIALWEESPVFYASMAVWTALSGCSLNRLHKANTMVLPDTVQKCLDRLNDAGYEAYVVGGCVRDALLGLEPQDYDMCTNATPRQICKLFPECQLVRSGEKHGTIGVVVGSQVYEITTFRTEGGYTDSRHPDWVKFVKNVRSDLARRDFTVNAMAFSPARGLVDPFGGQKDLKEKVLRTVGNPTERFTEDALRILRGARFAAKYRLTPHPETEAAMMQLAGTMDTLAQERIFSELSKLLTCATAEDLLRYAPLITQVIPELAPAVGFDQHTIHHRYDVFTHTAYAVAATKPVLSLRWAALLHDIAKPASFTIDEEGNGHFYGHAAASAEVAEKVLQRLRASNALREQVVTLIKLHMDPLTPDEKLLRKRLGQLEEETLRLLVNLQKADRIATGTGSDDTDYEAIDRIITAFLEENACLKVTDLAVSGNDLIAAGFAPGPRLGQVLEQLLEKVLEDQLPNEKAALLAAATAMKEETP